MKTSNKLFLSLLTLLLIIPILLLLAFKTSISNNRFTWVDDYANRISSMPLPEIHHVVVNGKGLACNFIRSEQSYCQWKADFIMGGAYSVSYSNDTLFIHYGLESQTYHYDAPVNICLPDVQSILAINTILNIDKTGKKLAITAIRSECNIGKYLLDDKHPSANLLDGWQQNKIIDNRTHTIDGKTTDLYNEINRLSIEADSSTVYIGNIMRIDSLLLTAKKASSIELREKAIIRTSQYNLDSTVKMKGKITSLQHILNNPTK